MQGIPHLSAIDEQLVAMQFAPIPQLYQRPA